MASKLQQKNWKAVAKRIELEARLAPGQAFDVMNELCLILASTFGPAVLSAMLDAGLALHRQTKPRKPRGPDHD